MRGTSEFSYYMDTSIPQLQEMCELGFISKSQYKRFCKKKAKLEGKKLRAQAKAQAIDQAIILKAVSTGIAVQDTGSLATKPKLKRLVISPESFSDYMNRANGRITASRTQQPALAPGEDPWNTVIVEREDK